MSASDHLNPEQFRYEGKSLPIPSGGTLHRVTAYSGDESVGRFSWHEKPHQFPNQPLAGEIASVNVNPEYHRQGVASGMYAAARALADLHGLAAPAHSVNRSPEGDAWAKYVSPASKVPPGR